MHGPEGLGAHVPATPAGSISARDGATLIAQEARRRPGEVLLVSTGPLTNVALALELEPELPDLLGWLRADGRGVRLRREHDAARSEANVWMDPEAAARVFDAWSGADALPACVGLDVTEQVWLSRMDLDAIAAPAPDSPLARLIRESMTFYIDFYATTGRTDGAAMHDPLAVAAALDPAPLHLDRHARGGRAGRAAGRAARPSPMSARSARARGRTGRRRRTRASRRPSTRRGPWSGRWSNACASS